MLFTQKGYKHKPSCYLRPSLGHPQLKGIYEFWTLLERDTTLQSIRQNKVYTTTGSVTVGPDSLVFPQNVACAISSGLSVTGGNYTLIFEITPLQRATNVSNYLMDNETDRTVLAVQNGTTSEYGAYIGSWNYFGATTYGVRQQVAYVFDTVAQELRCYKDGLLMGTPATYSSSRDFTTGIVLFSRYNVTSNTSFYGDVHSVRLYNRALVAGELAAIARDPWAPFVYDEPILSEGVAAPAGRVMSSLVGAGGLAGEGGIAGRGGGLAA